MWFVGIFFWENWHFGGNGDVWVETWGFRVKLVVLRYNVAILGKKVSILGINKQFESHKGEF